MTTYGTSYFTSKSAAVRYYKDYEGSIEDSKRAVEVKLREGSIHIGKPPLKAGDRLGTTDGGKRYTITTSNPRRRRKNGRSYATKGVSIGIPRYSFDPRKGDQFYVEGQLVTIKSVSGDMLNFNRSVDGTTGMSVSNLYQVARVPETSRFAPYDVRMRHSIPNGRTVPVRIRMKNGKTVAGRAKRVNGKLKLFMPPKMVRKLNPDRRWDIHEIKEANKASGYHFFDRDTIKFFHSKVFPTVYQGPGGVFFVTSEYRDTPADKEYKVRQFNVSNASIRTETTYKDKVSAAAHAKRSANRS